jgi:hypothetical protein
MPSGETFREKPEAWSTRYPLPGSACAAAAPRDRPVYQVGDGRPSNSFPTRSFTLLAQ